MAKTFRSYTVRVLEPTFVGEGLDGHLAAEGEVATVKLEIAAEEVTDPDTGKVTASGEPIYGDNLELIEADVTEYVPAGAPNGARATGVPGVFMVPIGDNWQVWTAGDPSTQLASREPEDFKYSDPDRPSIADDIEAGELLPSISERVNEDPFDHDNDGKPGGSLSKADLQKALDDRGIEWSATETKAELQAKLSAPPSV